MCFYVYSPNANLSVVFASERISLDNGGRSTILIDMLVKNNSESAIDSFNIIYPKAFTVFKDREEFYNKRIVRDVTHTVINDSYEQNMKYNIGGCVVELFEHVDKQEGESSKKCYRGEFSEPDPLIPYQSAHKEFFVKDVHPKNRDKVESNTIRPLFQGYSPDTDSVCLAILNKIKFSIFKFCFITHLKKDEVRLVRLGIGPYYSAVRRQTSFKEGILAIFDNVYFRYEIGGPYNVMQNFISSVKVFETAKKNALKEELVYIDKGMSLFRDLVDEIALSPAYFDRWRLHIRPNSFRALRDIVMIGNVCTYHKFPSDDESVNDYVVDKFYSKFPFKKIFAAINKKYDEIFPYLTRNYSFVTEGSFFEWNKDKHPEYARKDGFRVFFTCKKSGWKRNAVIFLIFIYLLMLNFVLVNMYLHFNGHEDFVKIVAGVDAATVTSYFESIKNITPYFDGLLSTFAFWGAVICLVLGWIIPCVYVLTKRYILWPVYFRIKDKYLS